jgi:hypothetical protein
MREVLPYFDSGRMADEYYEKMYHFEHKEEAVAQKKATIVNYSS